MKNLGKKMVIITDFFTDAVPAIKAGTVVSVNGNTKDATSHINGIRMNGYCVQYENIAFLVPENVVVDYEIWKTPLYQALIDW